MHRTAPWRRPTRHREPHREHAHHVIRRAYRLFLAGWAVALALVAAPAAALDATSPSTWAWSPASGEPERYDVLVDRGAGWTLERSVAATSVDLQGAPGTTVRVKVRGVRGLEVGPESPESVLVAWVAPPAAPREVWWLELSNARCREVHGWPEAQAVVWPRASSSVGPRIGCRERP